MRTWIFVLLIPAGSAQDFTQRGFMETDTLLYPQTAPNDHGRAVEQMLFRYEAFYKVSPSLRVAGGLDARADTHRQVERELGLSWQDRNRQRPAFAVRRLSATYSKGRLAIEAGKQFIRWGKADILNPTDRFAPRDYLNVVDNDFLAVTAARLTYGGQANTIDLIWQPRLTPSRVPLLNQRWVIFPENISVMELAPRFPGGSQFGARWNHLGRAAEYSLSFFNGYNHLPLIEAAVQLSPPAIAVQRFYPQMRMYGGDITLPLRFLTVRGEAAYFTSATRESDEYALYVIQLERQAGEWFFIGGYAGEAVTQHRGIRDFAPDRGLSRAFLGHAGYTIDPNRSLAIETAIRQNGKGLWTKLEYSQAFGQHWRATAAFNWIRGESGDFLGQYHRNSYASVALRYSF